MSMELSALLPRFASRQRVFVSYASEQVHAAKEIALALRQAGHTVYRDEEVIAEGGSYHDVLHDAIMRSDRFVFLVDKNALSGSRYTLSELKFAEQRWPAPRNRVLPVLLDRSIKMADLPAYLRAVDVLEPRGNAASDVVAAVERTRTMTPRWTAGLVTLVLAVAGAGAVFLPKVFQVNEVAFLPPDKVDFRPLVGPDADPPTTTGWRTSDVAVTGLQFG